MAALGRKTIIANKPSALTMNVPDTAENAALCLCPNCPTRNECMTRKGEQMFCVRGNTKCDLVHKGCFCGGCPLESEYQFAGLYFCESGSV